MDRYLFDVYKSDTRPATYGGHLLTDCVVFTLEGSLFFVLARSLSQDKWQRFYSTIIVLLTLDGGWGLLVWQREPSTIKSWVWLDFIFLILIAIVCFIPSKAKKGVPKYPKKAWVRSSVCLLLILARTILDYHYSWTFYFPS
jgi:small-conductance mechanosensitive channel